MVLPRQLSYAIETELKAPVFTAKGGFYAQKGYNYVIKTQRKAKDAP